MTRLGGTVDPYGEVALAHLAKVAEHNADALDDAADLVLACVRADGLVLTSGAGHSLAAVAETFFRAGGLACVRPLVHDDLQVFRGARQATAAERRSGLAAEVFASVPRSGHEVLFIFSNSGVNPFPVELARVALDAGCPVVAVTSPTSSAGAPRRAGGLLAQHATILLDTLTGPGDVAYPTDSPVTASLSTLCNAFLWNLLLARLHDRAVAEGVELPRWRSSNVEGGDAANAALLDRYGPRVPHLG
ncbi:sugar isomerase domain-containing protein [Actinokineospora soli]|uniref:Sugar isomerase domain-containing protein n=1 Tax=Actinokineospora soli TaxID=1048753 RepID=A0ABW2TJQ0_9PSEU